MCIRIRSVAMGSALPCRLSRSTKRCATMNFLATMHLLAALLVAGTPARAADDQPTYGLFGQLHLSRPSAAIEDVVILLSDREGWNAHDESLATPLAAQGALVVGVDLPAYLKRLAAIGDKCGYPSGHFEELAHWVERHEGIADYRNPLVIGEGAGAAFAYAMVAQAPSGTFAGLLTLGWDWDFRLAGPLCPGDAGAMTVAAGKSGYRIIPVANLPTTWLPRPFAVGAPWRGAAGLLAIVADGAEAVQPLFAAPTAAADLGRAYAGWRAGQASGQASLPDDIADLPLIEIDPVGADSQRIAVILTGDGGWAGLDKGVAGALAADGVRVVGFSTLKFFWKKRSPEESAEALRRTIEHYARLHPQSRFVVLGYSFGASLVPVLVNRLPAELRAKVDSGIMISPDADMVFEIRIGDWFGGAQHEGTLPLLPEIARTSVPLVCVHGDDESDSFCKPGVAKMRVLTLPGGHHYNGDYAALGKLVVGTLGKR